MDGFTERQTQIEESRRLRNGRDGGWIGVDLDGTLAAHDKWLGFGHVGEPIPRMVERVKKWRSLGIEVRILTARACDKDHTDRAVYDGQIKTIKAWLVKHIGEELPITCVKDYQMIELWDDRAIQVVANTGLRVDGLA